MTGETTQSHSALPPVAVARECLDIFMFEINGTGIAYEFDLGPRDFDAITKYVIPGHLNNRAYLQKRIESFGKYKEGLKGFAPFPLTYTIPDYSADNAPDKTVVREIEPKLLEVYDTFGQALDYYANVIDDRIAGRTEDDEVVSAAINLCKIAKPGMWDPSVEEGTHDYYNNPLRDTSPRWYLEVVMAKAA